MPSSGFRWNVQPHLAIEELTENLWRVQGSIEGMGLKRVMTVVKMSDGKLVIHNGIAVDKPTIEKIEAWGEPAYLIVPNGYHRIDAPAYAARYASIKVLCPWGARSRVQKVVRVDGTYENFPSNSNVQLVGIDGLGEQEGAMIVRSEDGHTLVLNDVLFNMPHTKGVAGFIFRHVTQSTGGPRVSRLMRWFVVKDKKALRRSLERLAQTPDLRRVIVSHHRMLSDNPAAVLREVASTL